MNLRISHSHERRLKYGWDSLPITSWTDSQRGKLTTKERSFKSMTVPMQHNQRKVYRTANHKTVLDRTKKIHKLSPAKIKRRDITGGSTKAPATPSVAPTERTSKVSKILLWNIAMYLSSIS